VSDFAKWPLLTGLALLMGCSADFDPPSRIEGLRVLAVRADEPYAAPGDTVQLTALAVDPAGRALQWGWGTCVDPDSSEVVDCIDHADWSGFTIAPDAPTHAVTIPADAIDRLAPAARARATVGVITVVCPGDLSLPSLPSSIEATGSLPFVCRDHATGRTLATDEYAAGVKRIFVRATDRNANPTIANVTWDGHDWSDTATQHAAVCATDGNSLANCDSVLHQVAANAAPGSAESGVDSFGASFAEQVIVQYYATEGSFSDGVRIASDPVTKWTARQETAGRTVTMWMVLRDDRGGVSWTSRTVQVQ
jgi:hypothetical protein